MGEVLTDSLRIWQIQSFYKQERDWIFASLGRTFATMLKGAGEDVKTVQELMRHASSRITLDVYAQAGTEAKRSAQNNIIELIKPEV